MAFKYRPISKKEIGTSLSEINVTPLVDVMLVLLIIFMVTAPMMQTNIGINLPTAETESSPAEEGLTLTIDNERYIYIGDQIINKLLLEDRLRTYFMGREQKTVYLRADESLNYGYIIEIIDIVKKSGIELIGLVYQPIESRR